MSGQFAEDLLGILFGKHDVRHNKQQASLKNLQRRQKRNNGCSRSSTCSTVRIISLINACISPRESAMLAALYTCARGV